MILATPVRLNRTNFGIEETLYMVLKGIEHSLYIRLVFQQIYPIETVLIIDKTHIKFETS